MAENSNFNFVEQLAFVKSHAKTIQRKQHTSELGEDTQNLEFALIIFAMAEASDNI